MTPKYLLLLLGGSICTSLAAVTLASAGKPAQPIVLDQKVDARTLARYHHIDQGTRLLPAAWLAALKTADGSSKLMAPSTVARFGFLQGDGTTALNPYAWPLGFTVSDPKSSGGVAIAGITCAACHTGQIEYRGRAVRIDGGQSMVDLAAFEGAVLAALRAVVDDPVRQTAFFRDAVEAGYPANRVKPDFVRFTGAASNMLHGQAALSKLAPGPGRVDAVQGIVDALLRHDIAVPANSRSYDAPVSYPYLWDIWRLSRLQYNGFLPPQALSRNIGEVLGTSGRTNIVDSAGALNPPPERWRTSIQLDNLLWLETVLKGLSAPTWPAQVLGPVDPTKAAHGRALFAAHCSGCHGIKQLPGGNWDVAIVPLKVIATDPDQATNFAGRTYDASKLGLGPAVNATAAATIINAVRRQLYSDNKVLSARRENDVRFDAPCGYKARPLIGVWATPPFLHNGAVRTIYDLLSDKRSASFGVGTRRFDPAKLGYIDDVGAGASRLDTHTTGNSNAGHWWTDDVARPGRIGPRLTEAEKYALIEYLKVANYRNYPTEKVTTQRPVACASEPHWAVERSRPQPRRR